MTKAEAISQLQERVDMISQYYAEDGLDDYKEALLMAINALNHLADHSKKVSSSCGQENDMVYRRAVIDIVRNECRCGEQAELIEEFEALPPAQPKILACGEGELNVPDTNVGDMIYRKAAIDAVMELFRRVPTNAIRAKKVIEELPSAQPEQRWIPTSERLPEDEQPIIFSTKTGRVHQGKYHKDDSANQWYSALDKMRAWNNVVNAWMPLPEPYAERREE